MEWYKDQDNPVVNVTSPGPLADMSDSYAHEYEPNTNSTRVIVTNYCIMASTALLWFDHGLTLKDEVERVWRRKCTLATLAYLTMRYSVVFARLLFIWEFTLRIDQTACGVVTHANDVLYIINLLSTSTVIAIRVYGISASNLRYLLVVIPLGLVRPVLYAIETAQYTPVQTGGLPGCMYKYTLSESTLTKFSIISSATMVASHAILVIVTAIRVYSFAKLARQSSMTQTPLVKLLIRDVVLFVIILVFNIIAKFYASPNNRATIWLVWPYFYEILNVIIVSRFVLDARGLYSPSSIESATAGGLPSPSLVFTHSPCYNNRLEGIQTIRVESRVIVDGRTM
ncbi:hypothetical protein C8Q74DRAFT_398071 [Fomes fomentarius]|nr:hypothetical protein C8Q74DRAFT_398071 [Fomes fomentarius]